MSKYKYLLWDVDGTILDFLAAEKAAVKKLFLEYGFGECTDEMISKYSSINLKYWKALERNEITKPQVLTGRFEEFFLSMGLPVEKVEAFNRDYQVALGDTIVFNDDSGELLMKLKDDYFCAAITNGTKIAQNKKLERSGLDKIFDKIFISEEIGVEKPNTEFFEKVFSELKIRDLSEVLVIGDSLTSDIKGGNNAGVDTCWYNPLEKGNEFCEPVTYEIKNLWEIIGILADN